MRFPLRRACLPLLARLCKGIGQNWRPPFNDSPAVHTPMTLSIIYVTYISLGGLDGRRVANQWGSELKARTVSLVIETSMLY